MAAFGCEEATGSNVTYLSGPGPIGAWTLAEPSPDAGDDRNASTDEDADALPGDDADAGPSRTSIWQGAESGGAVSMLTFETMTAPAKRGFQPKNVGAIWVSDESGKVVVKTLEVWAQTRLIFLLAYHKARAGASVDVTARATLLNHRMHKVSWDLKDKAGARVPPGKYKLMLELNDGEAIGELTAIEFDTSAGAMTLMPPDTTCYTQMKLQLE
jgi:hypothetical protein